MKTPVKAAVNVTLLSFGLLSFASELAHSQEQRQKNTTTTNCIEAHFGPELLACRCNASACDSGLKFEWPTEADEILRVSSNQGGARLQQRRLKLEPKNGVEMKSENEIVVKVEINKHFQRITGFGGAITDSAASLIMQLEASVRARLLEDYFGPSGLDYNMARMPIGGTDMSTRPYTYNDLPSLGEQQTDFMLNRFALQREDLEWKIPLLKMINKKRFEERRLPPLKLMTSCWSPPAWMKDNHRLIQGNLKLINDTEQASSEQGLKINPYYATYASYIIRFLEEYAKHDVNFWALSAQNEPRSPARNGIEIIHHNSVNFSPGQLVAFYKFHLLPQLRDSSLQNVQRMHHFVWEDVVDEIETYLTPLFAEDSIRQQVSGVALHWYSQGLREKPYSNVEQAFKSLPENCAMISSEASYLGGQKPGSWQHGAGYARDLMRTLRTGFIGWLDWNLALDSEGGPTWAQNPLDSAVQVDLATQSYIKNPMFYALTHVVRFVPQNSIIVSSSLIASKRLQKDNEDIYSLAGELGTILVASANGFRGTLARKISLVLHNTSNRARLVRLQLADCKLKRDFGDLSLELPPHSLESLAFIC